MEGDLAPARQKTDPGIDDPDPNRVLLRYRGPRNPSVPDYLLAEKIADIFGIEPRRVAVSYGGDLHVLEVDKVFQAERKLPENAHQLGSVHAFVASRAPSMKDRPLEFLAVERIYARPASEVEQNFKGAPKGSVATANGGSDHEDEAPARRVHGSPGVTPAGTPVRLGGHHASRRPSTPRPTTNFRPTGPRQNSTSNFRHPARTRTR